MQFYGSLKVHHWRWRSSDRHEVIIFARPITAFLSIHVAANCFPGGGALANNRIQSLYYFSKI